MGAEERKCDSVAHSSMKNQCASLQKSMNLMSEMETKFLWRERELRNIEFIWRDERKKYEPILEFKKYNNS